MKEKLRKIAVIASVTAGIAAIIFGVLDIANAMENADIYANLLFAVFLGLYAVSSWKENRKMAIVDIVIAAALLVIVAATVLL